MSKLKNIILSSLFTVLVLLSVSLTLALWSEGVKLQVPAARANLSGTVTLRVNVTIPLLANVTNVSFYYSTDNTTWTFIGVNDTYANATTGQNYTVSWDTSAINANQTYAVFAAINENGTVYSNSTAASNITIDNTGPGVAIKAYQYHENGNLQATHYTTNGTGIRFNVTASDAIMQIGTCLLYTNVSTAWGINATIIYTTITSGSEEQFNITVDTRYMNISTEGGYIWNVKCNDTLGNSLFNNTNYTIIYDATAPSSATITVPTSDTEFGNSAIVKCTRADATSGINDTFMTITTPDGTKIYRRDWNTTKASSIVSHTLASGSESELDEIGSYEVECVVKDRVGNSLTATKTSFTVATASSGGGGGTGGGGQTHTWPSVPDEGKSQLLAVNDQVTFTISDVSHTATITNVGADSATISIESPEAIELTLTPGESKKIDFGLDNVYDLSVELISIITSKANFKFTAITESYTGPAVPYEGAEAITPTTEPTTPTEPTPTTEPSSAVLWWTIGIIALIVIIALVISSTKKKK